MEDEKRLADPLRRRMIEVLQEREEEAYRLNALSDMLLSKLTPQELAELDNLVLTMREGGEGLGWALRRKK